MGTFQAGLSWKTAAGRLPVFLENFHNMEIKLVAAMMPDEIEKVMLDPLMIRNPRKINAMIQNAQAIMTIQKEYGSFAEYLWEFVGHRPLLTIYEEAYEVPKIMPIANKIAQELKQRGFCFVGPVITCMFLKASGILQDEVLNQEI